MSLGPRSVLLFLVPPPHLSSPLPCAFLASNQTSEFHFQASNIPMVTSRPMFWRKTTPRKTTIPIRFPGALGIWSFEVHIIDTFMDLDTHISAPVGTLCTHWLLLPTHGTWGNGHMAPGRMATFSRHLQPSSVRVKVPLVSGSGSACLLVPV